jgi:hypothetical protein
LIHSEYTHRIRQLADTMGNAASKAVIFILKAGLEPLFALCANKDDLELTPNAYVL